MKKWNFKTKEYDIEIDLPLKACMYSDKLGDIIQCAECGCYLAFGDSYTSLTIHNEFGLGYCVCRDCNSKEWGLKTNYENN